MNPEFLTRLAEAYAQHRALKLSTVSTYAANAGAFFAGLKNGNSCTFRKAQNVTAWFSDHWPADLEWPRDIPRPQKSKQEAA